MLYSVLGFNQQKMVEAGLDLKDILILDHLRNFINTGKMTPIYVEGKIFYWLNYENIREQLPILQLSNHSGIRKRFKKYEDLGIVHHYVKKASGTYSYYCLGEKFYELLNTAMKIGTPADENPGQNNNINKKNKKNIKKDCERDVVEEIWGAYPVKRGKVRAFKDIRNTLKTISREEFLRAVERYKEELIANNIEKKFVLNGSTFFHSRYQDYLDKNYGNKDKSDYTVEFDEL